MSVPGAEGDDTACPVCDSENIEAQEAVSIMGELAYRCLDCGAEFDGSGDGVLADVLLAALFAVGTGTRAGLEVDLVGTP